MKYTQELDLGFLPEQKIINILPKDGCAEYYGVIVSEQECQYFYNCFLNEIEWVRDRAIIFGKLIETKRKVAWYGQSDLGNPFNYTYSNTTKTSLPWTKPLLAIKDIIEQATNETYNACLLNLYHSGEEGMTWHSDGERDLKERGAIASLSLGVQRKFCFKHKKTKEVVNIELSPGSLLVMKDNTQENWLHRLPPTKKIKDIRINLTFRTIDI
ncbi:MAG: alpha-ketoglutarate-dependent dioxygenase AlkB family protein [Colwellia sp.]